MCSKRLTEKDIQELLEHTRVQVNPAFNQALQARLRARAIELRRASTAAEQQRHSLEDTRSGRSSVRSDVDGGQMSWLSRLGLGRLSAMNMLSTSVLAIAVLVFAFVIFLLPMLRDEANEPDATEEATENPIEEMTEPPDDTPTEMSVPMLSPTHTVTITLTPTDTATATPTLFVTATSTLALTATAIPTLTSTSTATLTATATATPPTPTLTPTLTFSPTPGPSGRFAYIAVMPDGKSHLYVMNADGSNQRRLTSMENVHQPAWSPDGTRIAFVSHSGYLAADGEIYVVKADGSGLTRLTNNSAFDWHPTWSPDGSRIAFASYRNGSGDIYLMNADGSNQSPLTQGSMRDDEPAWWPGNKIAFFRVNPYTMINTINPDGSGLTQLTPDDFIGLHQEWSPDGQRLAFVGYYYNPALDKVVAQIYLMNGDGSNIVRLTDGSIDCWHPAWSPDGKYVAFGCQDRIYVISLTGIILADIGMDGGIILEDEDWAP